MQVGDLVKAIYLYEDSPDRHLLGVIVAQVNEPRAFGNDVFKVQWTNGEVGEKIWDYDLRKVSA